MQSCSLRIRGSLQAFWAVRWQAAHQRASALALRFLGRPFLAGASGSPAAGCNRVKACNGIIVS